MSVRTTLGLEPPISADQLARGRSLWGDAWLRLRANRAAMVSGRFLILMMLACFVGPLLTPHAYTEIFQDYTKVAPSLSPYPAAASHLTTLNGALGGVTITEYRARPYTGQPVQAGAPPVGEVEIAVTAASAIGSDLADRVSALAAFQNAVVTNEDPDGRTAVVAAEIVVADIYNQALTRALRSARVNLDGFTVAADQQRIEVRISSSSRAIDARIDEFLNRSNLFGSTEVAAIDEDRRTATLVADIVPEVFYFGTDTNGRSMLARVLVAGRISLTIGILATVVALIVGITYGAVSGYAGGRVDILMMRIVDVLYSLPFIFFVILLIVFFGRNFILMFVAVGAIEWLDMARIVRGQTLSIKRREYVGAAHALGVRGGGILRRHVVPNLLGPVIIYVTLLVPKVILLESFLSFLSLGVQEPMTSWGVLIAEGQQNFQGAPWLLVFPSLFLISTLFALNFLGDGLRDALDPRDR